ncbi:MAG: methyltransferase domain-containing protein [Capsulimonadales bacterium]|nr:methyltransferase domain-containing protein [Capsulimonadales bacterium]
MFSLRFLNLVRCTKDGGALETVSVSASETISNGKVRCRQCGRFYRIWDGILDLLGEDGPQDADSRHELELRDGSEPILRGVQGTPPSWRDVAEVDSTLREIGSPEGKTILELGCGPGIYTRRLATADRLLAVDFSITALRRNLAQLPAGARVGLVRADVGTLRLTPNAFDLALTTLYSNLPTAELRRACNRTVAAALRPGGRYVVSAHHQDQRRILKKLPESGYYAEGGIFYQCFTPNSLKADLTDFRIEGMRPICVEVPFISRVPNDRLRAWVARQAAALPGVNRFGSILIAAVAKPDPAR